VSDDRNGKVSTVGFLVKVEAVSKVMSSLFLFGEVMESVFVYATLKTFILLLRQPLFFCKELKRMLLLLSRNEYRIEVTVYQKMQILFLSLLSS
jgi:hypothetical protein